MSFSQERAYFVANGHFRRPFRSCEMRVWGCEMALVCPKGCFAAAKTFAGVGLGLRNKFVKDASFRRGAIFAAKFSQAIEFACFWAPLVP